ncbi:disease resistance protein TAO1 isoform X1 [Arabidopsis lyrata subsp. lyrata]|uniref:disease resistance protein TAO1 isoform X1 n=1 Tax=Arabidopsis lyrata subsp. lyrata TaxID=81972 RepID=UPI000A29B5B1|nr:disease resistance protein TAO1 isoform X1 [Arabidopsis lyrata subsp. lyrata]|eukprot:XP_020869621.1 disease resistance protein TAO1 isoform X1 [Arabidopsis lyrata subsp. lyrata]
MMTTGASVSNPRSRVKWDAFLSFQRDTSHNFTDPLYEALVKKELRVWNDDLERGDNDELRPSLVEAIEDSVAFVVVLSPNYANSHLRLEELAKLCHLRSSLELLVFPIFYEVQPWEVRTHNGPFEKDFEEHSKRFGEEKIQRWKGAMALVGNLSGLIYGKPTDEDVKAGKNGEKVDELIGLVVKRVLAQVRNTPEKVADYIVGLESCVEDLVKLLNFKSTSGVQILGLYGMGGIGKTTLAKSFYNKIIVNFKHRVFIESVREKSSDQDGLVNLQKTLIKELFGLVPEIEDVSRGLEKIKENVHEKKTIVVLDDVDHIDQVNALVGETKWYGEGSLIVITTRDSEILSKLSVNQQYEVKCLTEPQALKLFSFYSLRKEKPPTQSLLELSKKIAEVTGLLPLAVKVFGSHLYDKDENEWPVELEKLTNTQPDKLHCVLALSFESLDDEEKKIFLDIACLFLKMEITKDELVDILKGCGFNAEAALRVLIQKSLVTIMTDDTLWMHDQIRDMGRQMVLRECSDDPEMRSRLWDRGEIMNVLDYMKGTSSIRGIVFDFKKKFVRDPTADEIVSRNLRNNPGINSVCNYLRNIFIRFPAEEKPKRSEITIPVEPFVPMKKLRLLQINNVELEGNLKLLPSELKWIQWKGCPLENLPPDILARQLGVLDLSESGVRRVQTLRSKKGDENLKVVNLRGCHSLEAIPDLSNHIALEKLVLERCNLLVKVHRSVGNLGKLLQLDLRRCSSLSEFLVDVSGLKCLEKLFLTGCSNLSVLPENIGSMPLLKELLLDGTAISNLPDSIFRLQKLEKLSLMGCRSIQELPSCIGKLTSLEDLYLDDTALRNLPISIGDLKNLQKLHLMRCTSLSKIPDSINKLISLKELFINGSAVEELPLDTGSLLCLKDLSAGDCKFLKQVPSSIGGLNSLLQLQLNGTPIEALPKEIGALHFIRKLELINCKFLKRLPNSIGDMDTLYSLNLVGSNIEELPEDFGKLENLVELRMSNCKMLKRLPKSFGDLKSLHRLYMQETSVAELPDNFGNLSNLMVLKMLKKPLRRSSESEAPGTSEEPRFVELPHSFSNLLSLEELDARSWRISGKMRDDLEKLSSLMILNLGNNYFHSLPSSLVGLSNLKELLLCDCRELKGLPPLPWKLEQLNLENCFSLDSIFDLSKLKILHELNLTNCVKVVDIPGLEHLTALKKLYMSGCNSSCSFPREDFIHNVKKRLSKASLKMLRNLSLPGNRVPDWFSQGPVTFSAQPNRELRGVILAVVVALKHKKEDDEYQLPDVLEVQAQIHKLDHHICTHTLQLSGVPRKSDDQLHICRYSGFHPLVTMLKDGYTIQVIKRNPPIKKGVELKMHGIHLVYEGDDDFPDKEDTITETYLTVSQKLANFFTSFEEGEASSEGAAT